RSWSLKSLFWLFCTLGVYVVISLKTSTLNFSRAAVFIRSRLENAAVPPAAVVFIAPMRLPNRKQLSTGDPEMYLTIKPASNLSPAPIASTVSFLRYAETKYFFPAEMAIEPFVPNLTTRFFTRHDKRPAAASTESVPQIAFNSEALGRKTST